MELINVEEVFCKDCEFKDKCNTIFCDVHNMPRAIIKEPSSAEWHDVYLIDSNHISMICGACDKRVTKHIHEESFSFCPYCGAKEQSYV